MNIPIETVRALICGGENAQQPQLTGKITTLEPNGENTIVVLDRGFVYIGKTRIVGDYCEISNARNIRVWGTKNGLGELKDGPKTETKLDDVGRVVAPLRAVIHFITCSRDW